MPKTNLLIKEWNGNWDELPAKSETFTFQGKHYYWLPCACGCNRPTGYDMSGQENMVMTMRLRGRNQGIPPEDMLVKYGWAEQYFATGHDMEQMTKLYIKMILEAEDLADEAGVTIIEFLAEKGITEDEYFEAEMLLAPAYLAVLSGRLVIE